MKKIYTFLAYLFLFFCASSFKGYGQSACSTCSVVTSFTANLSANPNSTYTVASIRNGLCCQGSGSDRCVRFEVTVHPQAAQIQFLVSTGNNGTWEIDCAAPVYTPSSKPCLNGLTSFCITYCNPGGASDTYTITTSSGLAAGADINLRAGCAGELTVNGLNEPSILWNSVFPGATGTYNSYLSCAAACDTTTVIPAVGAPAFIDYQACGTATGCSVGNFCDTQRVYISPALTVSISPASPVLCSAGPGSLVLTATVTGGNPAYTYSWTPGGQTTSTVSVSSAGTYSVAVNDNTAGCGAVTQTITVASVTTPTATATPSSETICSGSATSIALSSNSGTTTYAWTVSQSGVTGAANGSGSSITQTLSTTSASAGTATYTITPTDNGCTGAAIVATVTVNPIPTATVSPASQSICSGGATSLSLSSDVGGTTYSWTVTQTNVSGAANGSGSSITQTLSATTTSAGTATYTITPTAGGCAGSAVTATVTVNPVPSATATPSSQTICSGSATSIVLSSNVGGTTYAWTVSQSGVSGASAGSGASITQTLSATGASPGTATYTVTPTAGSCAGANIIVTVTVNPIPTATATPNAQSICSGGASAIALSSTSGGTTFAWTVTQTGVSGASAGSGTTITQTLTATGASAGTAVYTITPTLGTCNGSPITATVTVNPVPSATATPGSQSICSNTASSIALTSNVGGTTFAWTVTQSNVTGASASSGATIAQTLTATTSSAGTAIYTITPTAGGCAGPLITATVTVNPAPAMTSASTATICSGATVSIPLTSNVASTYTWIASDNVNTTGESLTTQSTATLSNTITNSSTTAQNVIYTVTPTSTAGSCTGASQTVTVTVNPTPVMTSANSATICGGGTVSIPLTSNIAATYTWIAADNVNTTGESLTTQSTATLSNTITNSTTSAQNVIYTVTPTAGACPGTSQTVTVTVNPTPAMTSATTATICTGNAVTINLTATVAGSTFTWIAGDNVNTTGESLTTQSTATLTNIITNGTAVAQNVIYTVTPTFGGCTGAAQTVTVTVNPVPAMTSANTATICSGGTVSIPLTANVPSNFTWIAGDNVNTTGESLTTQSTATLSNTITNSSAAVQNVIYTVTPTSTGGTCAGTAQTVTVTVNPTPVMTSANTATICSGAAVNLSLTSNVASNYTWIAANNANTTGESITTQNTATITDAITNNTAVSQNVIYTVTPTSTGGSCAGTPQTVTVTVNPAPVMTSASSATICTGNTVSIPLTSNVASTYTWIAANNPNTSGESLTTQSTATLSNTITNTTTASQNIIYTVTPTSTGGSCVGTSQTVTVQVNPTPSATATPNAQSICSNNPTSITLTSNVGGTTFSWTVSQTNVTGATASSGTLIAQTLTATTTSAGTAVYTITPSVGSCPGAAITATVTVNPAPSVTATPTSQTICSGNASSIALSSSTGGATFAWTVTQSGVSGASAGSGATIAQTLNTTGASAGTAIYTITPTAGGCAGTPVTATVTVNPIPSATATPSSQSFCSGGATSVALTSNVGGTTFAWTVSQSGTSGAANGSGSNITQTLTTTGVSSGTATYTITPTAGGCAGAAIVVTITVNPVPSATATPNSQTFCSGNTSSLSLSSNVGGTTFAWTVTQSGVSGASAGSGSTIAQTINTTGAATGTAIYTITPTAGTCSGSPVTATVTVNPLPVMTSVSSATICSGQTVSIPFTSNVAATYTWIATSNPNTTGESVTTQTTSTLSNTLTSSTGNTEVVIYTVTPTSTLGSCVGAAQTVSVTVSPTPVVTVTPNSQTLCSGGVATMTLTSNVGGTNFNWTVSQTGASGASAGSGTSITHTVNATGTSPGTVIYTVTPVIGSCSGTPATATVTVNPVPVLTVTPASQTICSGGATSITLSSNIGGSTFAWTVSQSGTSGAANGSGSSITQTLTATGSSAGTAIYTITPTAGTCSGIPLTATVTVNPIPSVTATPSSQAFCSGGATAIALSSDVGGATFSWTVSQSGVSGASNSSGATITQTLTTTGASPGTATYTITPTASACNGAPIIVTVTVNPIPATPTVSANSPVCLTGTLNLSTGLVSGATYNWSGPNGFSSTNQNPSVTNVGTADAGTYSLNITVSGCTSATQTVNVIINTPPPATLSPTSNSPVCTGQTLNLSIGSITSATYSWSGPNTFTSSLQNPTIGNIQLSGAGVYTVTATVPGCGASGTGTVSVVVNQTPAAPAATNNGPVCEGATLNLNAIGTGTTYSWTGPAGFSDNNQNPTIPNVTVSNAGVYSVTTTDNGCTSSIGTTTVIINVAPNADAGPDLVICKGTPNASLSGTVTVSNSGIWTTAGTGTFTPNANTLNATYVPGTADTASGSVILVLTSTNNGSCAADTDTLMITYADIPSVQAGSNQTVCANNLTVVLSGTVSAGSTTGIWSTSGTGTFTPNATTLNASYIPSNADTAAGTITLTLTSTGGCVVVTDNLTLTITDAPGANAGADIFVCANNPDASLNGTVSGATNTGIWSSTGTGTFTPSNTALTATYTPSGTDVSAGSVFIILTSTSNGSCNPAIDSLLLTFTAPPTAQAGNDTSFCANSTHTLGGIILGGSGSGTWTTSGSGTFTPNNNTLNATYSPSVADTSAGVVTFTLTSTNNGGCLAASDVVVVTITDGPSINAGTDQTVCSNNNIVSLNGQVGVSTGVSWSTTGDGTFGSASSTSTTYTPGTSDISNGNATIVITSTGNGGCNAVTDTMQIQIEAAPVVNAGNNQFVCSGVGVASLNGTVTGVSSTGTWTTLGSGTFGSASSLSTTYTLSPADTLAGSVTLVLTSTNNGSCNPATDTLLITITPAGYASVGNDTTICASTNSVSLAGIITGGSGAGQWSSSGTGTFTPSNTSLNATYVLSAADSVGGSVTITLTPINSCLPSADSLVITITPLPVVDAGIDLFICANTNTVSLNGSVTGTSTTGTWTTLGSGTFASASSLSTTYTLSTADSTAGSVTMVLTSTNNGVCGAVSDTMLVSTTNSTSAMVGADTSICSNDSLALAGIINGGSAGQWTSSGTGTFSPSGTSLNGYYLPSAGDISGGSVLLILTPSNGCQPQADSLVLSFNAASVVNAGSNLAICASTNTVALNGSVSGGSTTGTWTSSGTGTFSPNDSTLNATYNISTADSTAGSFTLILTSTNSGSCGAAKDSITVTITTPASALAGNDTTVCANNAVINLGGIINGGSGQGQWTSSGSGTFTPNDSTLNANYVPSGTDVSNGTVVLTLDPVNSCAPVSDSLVITITPAPTVNAGNDTAVCGSLVTLNGSINSVPSGAVWATNGNGTFFPNDSALFATYTAGVGDNDTLIFVLTTTGNGLCNAVSDTLRVILNPFPPVGFTFSGVCLGQTTNFTDTSGSAVAWNWNFGGGNTSTLQNPAVTFSVSGTYTVSLLISTSSGCVDSTAKLVTINPTPVASFSVANACFQDSVSFVDASTISPGNIVSWNWSFGDGNTSTQQNPVHLYDSVNVYTVSLSVTSDSGCTASITQTVSINPAPLAGFSLQSNCGSLLVNFTDTSSVSPDSITVWSWTFGDGNISSQQNPANTYSATGTYSVLLQVQTSNGCTDTASAVINLGQNVIADYIPAGGTYNTNQGITFTNQSTGATLYDWSFGNGDTSIVTDPAYTYTQPGTYTVVLISSNTLGCVDTVQYVFEINTNGVTVPTGFTPNGDGLNDYFYIMGGPFSSYELRIFNEWGNQIFMSNAQMDKWDGTIGGTKQPAGTYVYVFIGVTADGQKIKLQKEINLIR